MKYDTMSYCTRSNNNFVQYSPPYKVKDLEEKLENCTKNCENNPSKENVEELECLQAEYDDLYDYITIRSRYRANWYEKGEKNNTYRSFSLSRNEKKKSKTIQCKKLRNCEVIEHKEIRHLSKF